MMNRNIEQNRLIQEARIQKHLNEAATGVKSKSLFEKTDFVITDTTSMSMKLQRKLYTQSITVYSAMYTQHWCVTVLS